ncbi:MAG: hypothetical protein ACTSYS_07665 [Promethearchaeota archaeon]
MNFFENSKEKTPKDDQRSSIELEHFCVVFLAYFDEARGHQLLLVHPPELKNDEEFIKNESRTIFIHSIWWMSVELQEELSHVDLEFNGRNYVAKKFQAPSFRPKRRSGMTETTPETVVLILSIPINLNPFAGDLINKLYTTLSTKFKNDFSCAIEKSICEVKIIKSPRDKEVCERGTKILEKMHDEISKVFRDFGKNMQFTINSEEEKQKALAYLLYQDLKKKPLPVSEKNLFFEPASKHSKPMLENGKIEKIKLVDAYFNKDESKINFTLVNSSEEDLEQCSVHIAHLENFFEKYFYNIDIDYWFEDEELNFQFECIGKKIREEYLITVKQNDNVLFQKKIVTTKLRSI